MSYADVAPSSPGSRVDEPLIRIGKTRNGWEVECLDPGIAKANQGNGPWTDPWVCYSFETKDAALEFTEDAMDIVKPRKTQVSDAFEAAFKEATSGKETDNDEG